MSANLRTLNIAAAVIQGILAVFCIGWIVYSTTTGKDSSTPIPVVGGEFKPDGECGIIYESNANLIFGLLLAFTLVTMTFHILYATNSFGYTALVASGNNYMRWIEYSISATFMILVVAISSGVAEFDSQLLIGVMTIGCMLMGNVVERAFQRHDRTDVITGTFVGWILLVGAFVVIFRNFNTAATNPDASQRPPEWIWAVVIVLFLFYSSFGAIQLTQVIMGKTDPTTNRTFEVVYTSNSMVSKATLVLLLFGGFVSRTVNEDSSTETPSTDSTE